MTRFMQCFKSLAEMDVQVNRNNNESFIILDEENDKKFSIVDS
jgi:hypothetical protein